MPSQGQAEDAGAHGTIVFAPFCLDLRAVQLLRGSRAVPLQPKAFAVLRHLAERPGALVTKRELLDAVWADAAVTENSLTQSIRQLRRALQDDTTPPRFIETVHRRGFRFIAALGPGIGPEQPLPTLENNDRGTRHPGLSAQACALSIPFVGRTAELHRLDELLVQAQQGQRQVVFVTGEAGIGKTSLVESFLAASAASQILVARGQAVEQAGAREPYLSVLDALERLARAADPQRTVPLLRRTAPAWLAQMPWLLEPADAAALRQSLIDVRPERMLRELAVFLEELTATTTLILVLEDLHWSDPSTIELLQMLAQRSEPARLLVIGTYRPAEASLQEHPLVRVKHTLRLRQQCSEIALQYLTAADIDAYLGRRFPGAGFPHALAGLIQEHTDGNPLFMVAVANQLITRGWLVATDPGWALTVSLEKLLLEVPDDLRDVIRFQFHGMGPADRSLLEAASVNGGNSTVAELAPAIDAELRAAEEACEQMVRTSRFLRIADDAAIPGEHTARRYRFIHALYQHVIYEEIPAGRRRRLHLRLGEALERSIGDSAFHNAFRLASHFERGGDVPRAITAYEAAAAAAQHRFAPREAIGCLEVALRLSEQLPEPEQRREREIELRLLLTAALNLVYGFASDEVRESCERTRALCEHSGHLRELYEVLYALWYSQAVRAEKDTTHATAAQLVQVAERLDSPEHRLRAARVRGQTAMYEGDYRQAGDTLAAVIADWETVPGASTNSLYGTDPIVAAYAHSAMAQWFLGYPEGARRTYEKALTCAQQAALPFTLTAAHTHAALGAILCGSSSETLRLAERGLALASEHAFPMWHGLTVAFRGWAHTRAGQPAGQAEVRAAIALLDSNRVRLMKPFLLALLAEGDLRLGNLRAGLASVNEGLQLTHTTLDRFYEPELWRLQGELLLAQSKENKTRSTGRKVKVDEAERSFQSALQMARERGARSLQLRAATSLARLEQITGDRGSAYDVLAGVYGSFTEGFDTQDLQEARLLLN